MSFDAAFDKVIGLEGTYSNNPNDPGGETMWGITKNTARANGYIDAMRVMPKQVAKNIYEAQYFKKPHFDRVDAINSNIASELFEIEVNMPPGVAAKFLQRSLNLFNGQQKYYADIAVDGSIGNATITALQRYIQKRGNEGVSVLLTLINVLQGYYYVERAEEKQTKEDFIYGWIRTRVMLK